MSDEHDRRCTVLLAVQNALLGEVTGNLRAVTVEFDDKSLRLDAFFDEQPGEEDEEAMSLVETGLVAAFPAAHTLIVSLITRPEPQLIPNGRAWAYARRESLLES